MAAIRVDAARRLRPDQLEAWLLAAGFAVVDGGPGLLKLTPAGREVARALTLSRRTAGAPGHGNEDGGCPIAAKEREPSANSHRKVGDDQQQGKPNFGVSTVLVA
jgi:hypothetical protein